MTPISGTQWNNDITVDGPNAPTGDDALVYMNYVTPRLSCHPAVAAACGPQLR